MNRFSSFFRFALLGLFLGVLIWLMHKFEIKASSDYLPNIALAIGGIIGASIAIIFSFSTFILQSTADLFSTQYLNKFVEDKKERFFFWLLVSLTGLSFSAPFIFQKYVLEVLLSVLFLAFYFIYELYIGLRERINPENTLTKIKIDSLKMLEKTNKASKKHAHIQRKNSGESEALSIAGYYRDSPDWHEMISQNVKYLYEIGLRLLAKNEIIALNSTIEHIRDIYLKQLDLRDGCFIRNPVFLGGYSCDDDGFTNQLFDCLQSLEERVIQEKRKENIYCLLRVYESIIERALCIKYADDVQEKVNPLLNLVLVSYKEFIEKLLASKENNWVFEIIKNLSNVSNSTLKKTDDLYIHGQINILLNKALAYCCAENQKSYLKLFVGIYFSQIFIAWNKYGDNTIFWERSFEGLKISVRSVSKLSESEFLLLGGLFYKFRLWQIKLTISAINLKDEEERQKFLSDFIALLERWREFLFGFARQFGINETGIGLSVIQSVETNLEIIYWARDKFQLTKNIDQIYIKQFRILSCYFQETDKIVSHHLRNLNYVLKILLQEICNNLKGGSFDVEYLIDIYVKLIRQHFDKVDANDKFARPPIIKKLVCLGLLLNKYEGCFEEEVLSEMDELNDEYVRSKEDSLRLCKEIHDLGWRLLYSDSLDDLEGVLRTAKVGKQEWSSFVKKINRCNAYDIADINPIRSSEFPPV